MNKVWVAAALGAALVVIPCSARAQQTATAVRVDGAFTEDAWVKAEPITTFVQRDPDEGAAPSHRTEARVLFDDSAIYIAVKAFDAEPDKVKGYLTRRDVGSSSDWVRVYIDSYHDRRTAYSFAVNPVGVKLDTYHFNDDNEDSSWDAVWEAVTARDAEGWRAEFRIPYSQLRFSDGGDGRLGFAIARTVARVNETSTWPLISKNASGWVSQFGELAGVDRPASSKRLELVPYTVAQLTSEPEQRGNPLQRNPDPGASVGMDLKYAVTPGLTLSATINPDFGQVEADPAVVNLGAFETFFDERRPFFIEGSGNFQVDCRDCQIFYSRRIGRAPRGAPALDTGEFMVSPTQSTILGAGKLTGRVGKFSLGALTAVTQEESALIANGTFRRRDIVEPRTFYSVSRLKREFDDQSSIGVVLTTTTRGLTDAVRFLPSGATTGGADVNWRLGSSYALDMNWAASRVTGSSEAISLLQRSTVHMYQRPDAGHVALDPLATSMSGHSGSVAFNKIAGERTRFNVNVGYLTPGFDTNDVGFLSRADRIPQGSWFGLKWETPGRYLRNWRLNFNQWSAFNFDGERLELGYNTNAHFTFQNLWRTGFGVNVNHDGFDDRLTRGGPGGRRPGNINSWQYFSSPDQNVVRVGLDSNFGNDRDGSSWYNFSPGVDVKPTTALNVGLFLSYDRNTRDAQWVRAEGSAPDVHYVFGRLDQTTTSVTTRVNYTITPTLSLQLYARPFVSAGDYANFRELVNPLGHRNADRYQAYGYAGNPDFNVLSFRSTNVLRWEYRPGSALFVVWQHGREGFAQHGNYSFGRDFGDVFGSPQSNALLIKLAHWFNP
jgi:hypothetical protein